MVNDGGPSSGALGFCSREGRYAATMRAAVLIASVLGALLLGACGDAGPEAPPVGAIVTACADDFCIGYPDGWEVVEQTGEFVSLRHPDAPNDVVATAGHVNMEGVVSANGKTWPQTTEDVVRSFWAIIDGGGAELATMDPLRDGSIKSFGTFADGRLWYRLTPVEGRDAIGVEMRGPNSTWSTHADVMLDSLVLVP